MNKELEAFENIMRIYGKTNSLEGTYNDFLTIKKALQRLEAIDNTNPSEALKCLENIGELCYIEADNLDESVFMYANQCHGFDTIKNYILKAQKQEPDIIIYKVTINNLKKVLNIIIKKNVMVYALKVSKTVNDYNNFISTDEQLTEEEFILLKRYIGDDENN